LKSLLSDEDIARLYDEQQEFEANQFLEQIQAYYSEAQPDGNGASDFEYDNDGECIM
jgi:hypothetical protein